MGSIIKRTTKRGQKFYLKYKDGDGVERMRAAKGATTREHAQEMMSEIERGIFGGRIRSRRDHDEQALIAEYERWERHHCPTCGRIHAPEVF